MTKRANINSQCNQNPRCCKEAWDHAYGAHAERLNELRSKGWTGVKLTALTRTYALQTHRYWRRYNEGPYGYSETADRGGRKPELMNDPYTWTAGGYVPVA